jgi:hypothetical protein
MWTEGESARDREGLVSRYGESCWVEAIALGEGWLPRRIWICTETCICMHRWTSIVVLKEYP